MHAMACWFHSVCMCVRAYVCSMVSNAFCTDGRKPYTGIIIFCTINASPAAYMREWEREREREREKGGFLFSSSSSHIFRHEHIM